MLGPCCWVSGWTKIIGKSIVPHPTPEDLVRDSLATFVMPFSLAGFAGTSVMGQAMPGEQNNAYNYKQRKPAWVFTYAPGAVFAMVKRVAEVVRDMRVVDAVATMAIENAIYLLSMLLSLPLFMLAAWALLAIFRAVKAARDF